MPPTWCINLLSLRGKARAIFIRHRSREARASIFIYRVGSNDPAIRKPEIGRSVVHKEGLALLTQYIQELRTET